MIDKLIEAIQYTHGCNAEHSEDIPTQEEFDGETVWSGVVSVFRADHPQTDICYAWQDSESNKIFAVLKLPPVDSPLKAVRAAIVHQFKEGKL